MTKAIYRSFIENSVKTVSVWLAKTGVGPSKKCLEHVD